MVSRRSSSSRAAAWRAAFLATCLCALAAVMPASAAAGVRSVQVMDRCDPASFNAMFGDVCALRNSGVPVGEFLSQVNPVDFGHDAWRFSPAQRTLRPGDVLHLNNRGGETHSFTEVEAFGGGIVPPLNAVFPPDTALAVPIGAPRFLPAGSELEFGGLSVGPHRFQCLIHPWMEATIVQT
jgi:plastocyanin